VDKNSEMFEYDDESFQVKNDQVIMKFRAPLDSEKSIQFWRHKFSSETYSIESHNKSEHTQDYKLINLNRGITVVFSESGTVLRIAKSGEKLDE
jgi:hypothetical protein